MAEGKKWRVSLKWRLILLVGGIIVPMVMIMAGVYVVQMSKAFTKNAEAYIESRLSLVSEEIRGWFESKIPLLDAAEGALSLIDLSDKKLYEKYIPTLALYTNAEVRGIYIGSKLSPREGGRFYSSDAWVPPADYDWTKRPWFQAAVQSGGIAFTSPYIDAIRGDLVLSIGRPVKRKGVVAGVIALDLGITTVQTLVQRLTVTPSAKVFLLDDKGIYLTHQDTNKVLKMTLWDEKEMSDFKGVAGSNSFVFVIKGKKYMAMMPLRLYNVTWKVVAYGNAMDILGAFYSSLAWNLAISGVMFVLVVIALVVAGSWLSPLTLMRELSQQIARGKLVLPHITYRHDDEISALIEAFGEIVASLRQKEVFLLAVKEGDFTKPVPIASKDDTVGFALERMTEQLSELIRTVKESIHQTMISVEQLKKATQHLSQGSTEQAAVVEEITSSVKEIQAQAKQNFSYATQSIEIMKHLLAVVEENKSQLNRLQEAMRKNTEASEQIKAVVKTIDDIAFQINLLALNANVEAARAGKYGKGFAVVADEVRNLAVKSAQAARDTATIVEETVHNLLASDNVLKESTAKFDQIVQRSQDMSSMMQEIGKLSQAQSVGLDQISQRLSQISVAVQSVAASAEETASAASELAGQTQSLRQMVEVFKTKE